MPASTPSARKRRSRLPGMALVGALAATFLPFNAASAQTAPPEPVDVTEFCANAPEDSTFTDIEDTTFRNDIICLALTGITEGVTPTTFDVGGEVTRGQMASFIARLVDTANEVQVGAVAELPDSAPDAFTDVDGSHTHAANINRLAAADIVFGGPEELPSTQYGPSLPVTRGQMASLINRAIGFMTGDELSTTTSFFTDVTARNPHAPSINAIASVGIAIGVGDDRYLPTATVLRGQMAAFLMRSLAHLEAEGVVAPVPPPANASFTTSLGALNGSGASGTATVDIEGDVATVQVDITGASADLPHAQHIHIGGTNECPTMAADEDGDGFVSTPEGVPSYGGVAVSLTTTGDVTPSSALAVDRMPVASASGVISYERTFRLPGDVDAADIADGVIVSHGIADTSLGTDDTTYDGPDSPLSADVPQEATLPAACGALGAAAGATGFDAVLGPLNGSAAVGTASVLVNGNLATVTVDITGTSPELPHAQHIHIGGTNDCPTILADTDGDGFISTPEGLPNYGDIAVSLTVEGDTSPASALALSRMPVASDGEVVTYERTFVLPAGVAAADIANGVIVSHGVAETTLGSDNTVYDGRDSPLAAGVPQEATLPASCGPLNPAV